MIATKWLGLPTLMLLGACSRPLPPPAPAPRVVTGPPPRDVGPLVPLGHTGDHVSSANSPVSPDGELDFALRVRLSGDVRALVIYGSDVAGAPNGNEVWDTMTAPDVFPPEWHLPVPARDSWAIAVLRDKTLLNPNVVLDTRSFNNEELTLFVSDPGRARFVSGRTFSLLVVRSDGKTDRATTTVL